MTRIEVWLKGTGGLTSNQINVPSTPEEAALAERVRSRLFCNFNAERDVGLYELGFTIEIEAGVEPTTAEDDPGILEWVFQEGNIGDSSDFAVGYRTAGNRSISVGDVVVIDDRTYACASSGWTPLEYLPEDARRKVTT